MHIVSLLPIRRVAKVLLWNKKTPVEEGYGHRLHYSSVVHDSTIFKESFYQEPTMKLSILF